MDGRFLLTACAVYSHCMSNKNLIGMPPTHQKAYVTRPWRPSSVRGVRRNVPMLVGNRTYKGEATKKQQHDVPHEIMWLTIPQATKSHMLNDNTCTTYNQASS